MLALTRANPSAFPMILHSKGRITYLPSFREILGSHTFDMDFSLDCHCTGEGHEYRLFKSMVSTRYPAVPEHSEKSRMPLEPGVITSPPWQAALGRNRGTKTTGPINTNNQHSQQASPSPNQPLQHPPRFFFFGVFGGTQMPRCKN